MLKNKNLLVTTNHNNKEVDNLNKQEMLTNLFCWFVILFWIEVASQIKIKIINTLKKIVRWIY